MTLEVIAATCECGQPAEGGNLCSSCREQQMSTQGYQKCYHFALCGNWYRPAEGRAEFCLPCRQSRCHVQAPGTHSGLLVKRGNSLYCQAHDLEGAVEGMVDHINHRFAHNRTPGLISG